MKIRRESMKPTVLQDEVEADSGIDFIVVEGPVKASFIHSSSSNHTLDSCQRKRPITPPHISYINMAWPTHQNLFFLKKK